MAIFAIADPHLSLGCHKPMDIFGERWSNHEIQLSRAWMESVGPEDTVIIPGDISWAMTLEEALPDLAFLHQLPGRKILSKGNHDYWWGTLNKTQTFAATHGLTSLSFLKNNAFVVEGQVICGTRGWLLPTDSEFTATDQTIYNREIGRLEASLTAGKALLSNSDLEIKTLNSEQSKNLGRIITVMHYPPLQVNGVDTEFTNILEKYEVDLCIYGHLHGRGLKKAFEGFFHGVEYHLVSGDHISFKPLRL